jgi:hypothetical protein
VALSVQRASDSAESFRLRSAGIAARAAELAKVTACETVERVQKTPRRRRAVVLLHIVDRSDLVWIPPLVQRAKVEAFAKAEGFELVELLSDGFQSAEDPAFFNKGFQMLEDGKADVLLPLKLEADGRLVRGAQRKADRLDTTRHRGAERVGVCAVFR